MKYIISALCLIAQILVFASQPVCIFLPSIDFDWVQYEFITEKLDNEGIPYFVISDKKDTCKASGGRYIIPFNSVQDNDIAVNYLIIPGSTGIIRIYENEHLLGMIRDIHSRGGIVASTGYGAMPIVHSGIAEGGKISMIFNSAFYSRHKDSGVKFVYYDAIMDNNILTSLSRDYIIAFMNNFIRIYNETAHTEGE